VLISEYQGLIHLAALKINGFLKSIIEKIELQGPVLEFFQMKKIGFRV
jgi:hypothetical protein